MPERPFDLASHRYLVDIYKDPSPEMVIEKAGQMGASEYSISWVLWAADLHLATPLYVFPTEGHVSDFSSARLGPGIEASAYLQELVVSAAGKGKRGADRVKLKRVRNRFLYFRGGKVTPDGRAPQLKSIDADVLVLDEVDEIDARAPSIAVKRLGHSDLGWIRWISTPSYTGMGIDAKFAESDARTWHVRCGACGHWQDLTIDDVVIEWDELQRPVAWHGAPDDAWAACRKCGGQLNRVGPGQWVAAHPGRELRGYHLTGLFSAHKRLLNLVRNLCTTDETQRKEAHNQDLGLPHKPTGQQITDDVLDACRRDYGLGPRPGATFAGVDVGKLLHVVIRADEDRETGERAARFIGAVTSFEEVGRLFKLHKVKRAVVDALPETRAAREFQEGLPKGRIWLAYYDQGPRGTKRQPELQWKKKEGIVNMDRTRTLDSTFSKIVESLLTLPANARDLDDYYDHLKAPVRTIEKAADGNLVARYIGSDADHFCHAENYCLAAATGRVWRDVGFEKV